MLFISFDLDLGTFSLVQDHRMVGTVPGVGKRFKVPSNQDLIPRHHTVDGLVLSLSIEIDRSGNMPVVGHVARRI